MKRYRNNNEDAVRSTIVSNVEPMKVPTESGSVLNRFMNKNVKQKYNNKL